MYAENEKIKPVRLQNELQGSFIDYAMSVIVSRALPDARDGLKPVHRRILVSMKDLRLEPNRKHVKSAKVTGHCSGTYHPHGDQIIYPSMVRMAQSFNLRYPLVNGQGNFGSVDGDPPAAMRYTEVKMTQLGADMLEDIEKDTVPFGPNYDSTTEEPLVAPSLFPNLLVNGSSGIAVGMATNMPPHNLGETIDAIELLIDDHDVSIPQLMQKIQGPDFPTGGLIMGLEGIREAYMTGRGRVRVRARAHVEKVKGGSRENIIITEISYQVNKSRLLENIADLVRDKKIEGISDLRDESDRDGMRIVVELKRNELPEVVLNQLYKHALQTTFGVIMLALVDNQPKVLNLKQLLECFLNHRIVVVRRRTQFLLDKAERRAHILEGLKIALDHIDEVIATIRSSQTTAEAKTALMGKFKLSELQAEAILEMRLSRLTGLERGKIDEEYRALIEEISRLKTLLSSDRNIKENIREELREIRKKFADSRRTDILPEATDFRVEDLIADEDMVITISHAGYIKRLPVSTYRKQRRGGRGVAGMQTRDEDFVEHLFIASTHQYILFFTDAGRVYWLKVHEIPRAGRTSKGRAVVNMLNIDKEEKLTAFLNVKEFTEDQFVFMATERGTVKKTSLKAFSNPRKGGIIALKLDDGDKLLGVKLTTGHDMILIATRNGMAIRFEEENVRVMGRTARGVRGIRLKDDDVVIGMEPVSGEEYVLSATENGYGKRSKAEDYRLIGRGGQGVIDIKTTKRNGHVIGMKTVKENDEIMMITQNGIIIRYSVGDTRAIGRNTQGVKLINLDDGDTLMAIAHMAEKDEDEEINGEELKEATTDIADNGDTTEETATE
ncbi:DNA gyrase subunit A [Candidatus Hydrogenedentota bacterium]